jgi:hypothetical protein
MRDKSSTPLALGSPTHDRRETALGRRLPISISLALASGCVGPASIDAQGQPPGSSSSWFSYQSQRSSPWSSRARETALALGRFESKRPSATAFMQSGTKVGNSPAGRSPQRLPVRSRGGRRMERAGGPVEIGPQGAQGAQRTPGSSVPRVGHELP